MQRCKCGASIPIEACPTCPPIPWTCPECGETTLVEVLNTETIAQIMKEYKARHPEFRSRRK